MKRGGGNVDRGREWGKRGEIGKKEESVWRKKAGEAIKGGERRAKRRVRKEGVKGGRGKKTGG